MAKSQKRKVAQEAPDFISDEEMAASQSKEAPDFISDEEMSQMESGGKGQSAMRGFVEDLPIYGATAGGLIGGAGGTFLAPGPGTIGGAFAGAAAGGGLGEATKNLIRRHLYDEEVPAEEVLAGPVKAAAMGMAGEATGGLLSKGAGLAGKGLLRVSGELSNVPKKAVDTYLEKSPKVREMGKRFGEDLQGASDFVRKKYDEAIRSFKGEQNAALEKGINKSQKLVDATPVLSQLEETIGRLDQVAQAKEISEIQKLQSTIIDIAEESGGIDQVPLQRLNNIKKSLQAATDYRNKDSSLALNDIANAGTGRAASKANAILGAAEPEARAANRKLSRLHGATKGINKRMVTEGEAPNSLLQAGGNPGSKPARDLRRLEGVIESPLTEDAEVLASMNALENAGLLPNLNTGRALAPLVLGAAGGGSDAARDLYAGDFAGAASGLGTGLLSASISSPLMLRQLLRARLLQQRLAPEALKFPSRYLGQEAMGLLDD